EDVCAPRAAGDGDLFTSAFCADDEQLPEAVIGTSQTYKSPGDRSGAFQKQASFARLDSRGRLSLHEFPTYWIALPTCENTLPAFDPMSRTVPTTITRMTASITEYSATSCPCS